MSVLFRCWSICSTLCAQLKRLCKEGLLLPLLISAHQMISVLSLLRTMVRISCGHVFVIILVSFCEMSEMCGLEWAWEIFDLAWWWAGMDVLLDMLNGFASPKNQQDGALALCTLARKANALSPIDAAPLPPTPQVCPSNLLGIHREQCFCCKIWGQV